MKYKHRIVVPFCLLLSAALVLPAAYAHSQEVAAINQPSGGSTSIIVLSRLSSPTNDPVAEELASSITNTIGLTMQLTGRLEVKRADFLAPTTTFTRSLLYYRQVHADGAVFGSVKRAAEGRYVVVLEVWNAAHSEAKQQSETSTSATPVTQSQSLVANGSTSKRQSPTGSIILSTESPGVFSIDGVAESHVTAGSTTELTYLTPGPHIIEMVFDNGSAQERRVVVHSHQSAPVLVSFAAGKPVGSIRVTTELSGLLRVPNSQPIRLLAGTSTTIVNPPAGGFNVTMQFDNGTTRRVRVYSAGTNGPEVRLAFGPSTSSPSRRTGSIGLSTGLSGVFYLDGVRESHVNAGSSVTLKYLSPGPHDVKMLFDIGATQDTTVYVPSIGGVSVSVIFASGGAVPAA